MIDSRYLNLCITADYEIFQREIFAWYSNFTLQYIIMEVVSVYYPYTVCYAWRPQTQYIDSFPVQTFSLQPVLRIRTIF
jgi:hypothetical protein